LKQIIFLIDGRNNQLHPTFKFDMIHRWIKQGKAKFKKHNLVTSYLNNLIQRLLNRCYVNGETHLYLGKQYRLKLVEGPENSVKLSRGFFHITCRSEPTPTAAEKLLKQWYSEKAQLQFVESMDRCWQKFKGLDIGQLSIMRMQKMGQPFRQGHSYP